MAHIGPLGSTVANLTGLPALVFPAGATAGLSVGMQLMGRAWDEAGLFEAAQASLDEPQPKM